MVTAAAQVTAMVQVRCLTWELPRAMGAAKKKKKKKENNKNLNPIFPNEPRECEKVIEGIEDCHKMG